MKNISISANNQVRGQTPGLGVGEASILWTTRDAQGGRLLLKGWAILLLGARVTSQREKPPEIPVRQPSPPETRQDTAVGAG